MRKLLIFVLFIGFISPILAQPTSLLQPVHVYWQADNGKIFLPTALKKGVPVPDSLNLVMLFSKEDVKAASKNKALELEFQWYRYASTTRFFVKSQKLSSYSEVRNGKYYVAYKASMHNLKKGWWEVEVISYSDNGIIKYRNFKKFQILLR